jgi:hypothetical protein
MQLIFGSTITEEELPRGWENQFVPEIIDLYMQ